MAAVQARIAKAMALIDKTDKLDQKNDKKMEQVVEIGERMQESTKKIFGVLSRGYQNNNSVSLQTEEKVPIEDMHKVFVYGTLMNPEVRGKFANIQGERVIEGATIQDYHRYRLQGAPYPVVKKKLG